jgi:hypothetical protein
MAHFSTSLVAKHFDDIESGRNAVHVELFQPFLSRSNDPSLFFPIHRFLWCSVPFAGASFYLNENEFQPVSFPANKVDFAAVSRLVIAVQNFVTRLLEEPCGKLFAFLAQVGA